MSFNQIIFKNFKQNIARYAIYLLSLIISVVLYFSFVTLKYAHHLHGNQSYPIIKEGSQVGSYFLFIIIIVFLLYANFLFMKRRGRELSLLQIIGLTRSNIMRMIMLEQLMTFNNSNYWYCCRYFWFENTFNDCASITGHKY